MVIRTQEVARMTGLKEKLEAYKELKKFIKEYNGNEYQKGLDLGVRILTDLINKYPNQVGNAKIEWEDDYFKEDLLLKIGVPFENNKYFFNEVKSAKDYILKRYPDAREHYLGIQLAKCISKRNIDKFIKEMEDDE